MANNILYNYSATTATIVFDGNEVGELQNVTIEENYNLRPLSEVGSTNVVTFVPGVFRGTLRVQRGILDMDRVIQNLVPSMDKASLDGFLNVVLSSGRAKLRRITDLKELTAFYIDTYNERMKSNRLSHVVSFDVEIKDVDENVFLRLEDCMINTRKITIDSNSLVILQNVDFMYRKRPI